MLRRAILASLLLVFTLALPASGQVALKWKLREGDFFYLDEKVVGKTTLTVQNQKSTEEQTQHRLSRFVVKSGTRETFVLEQRIESWKSTTTGGLSGDQDDTKLLEQMAKGILFTIHLSPGGAITRFEGFDQLAKKLDKLDAAEAKRFRAAFNEDVFRSPLAQIFDILPTGAVKKGQSWTRNNAVSMGPMGTFIVNTTYAFVGSTGGGEEIATKAALSYQVPKGNAPELGFKVIKLDLTKNDANGRVVFDNVKGRLVLMEMKMPLAGTMHLEVMGTRLEVQLDGTDTRTIRLLDKRP